MHNILASISFDKGDIWIVIASVLFTLVVFRIKKFPTPMNSDHFWRNFPSFVLLFLFVFLILVALHMIHHGVDQGSISWIQNLVSQIFSGLTIALGVARAMQQPPPQDTGTMTLKTTVAPMHVSSEQGQTKVETVSPDAKPIV
jgi:predicted tellurium resistance membrane protein TerC